MSDEFSWYQLCTALDTVDDTEEAMSAYEGNEFPSSNGERYLRIYGVLQAMFVQQDSLHDLIRVVHPSTNINVKDLLKDVRRARNASVGHPTSLGRGTTLSTHAIVQMSMHKDGFELLSYPKTTDRLFELIPVLDLIKKQRNEAVRILSEVIEDLRKQEEVHRSAFRVFEIEECIRSSLVRVRKNI